MAFLQEAVIHIEDYKRKKRLLKGIKTLEELLKWSDKSKDETEKIVSNIHEKYLGLRSIEKADVNELLAITKDLKQELDKRNIQKMDVDAKNKDKNREF